MGEIQKRRDAELALIKSVASQCGSAVITGPAAARWIGLSTRSWVEVVDLCLPSNSNAWGKNYPDRVYRSGALTPEEWISHKSVRTAIGIRAIFDSYRYYGRLEALVQLESARWRYQHLTTDELLRRTEVLPKARGIRGFRELIAYSADTSASPLETVFRDKLLTAITTGQLTGVETIEFQVGFQIVDPQGHPTVAWADALINGFIFLEADGSEKTSGVMGDAEASVNLERHREKQLQNDGGVFFRVGWGDLNNTDFLRRLQRIIDLHPGVRRLSSRLGITYREWLNEMKKSFT